MRSCRILVGLTVEAGVSDTSQWVTTYVPLITTLVVAGANVVLVILTSRYVRLTGRIVDESQKAREPFVTVDFELPDRTLRLVVENHGLMPARNIRIEVLRDVEWLRARKERTGLSDVGPIKEGISYLTPSRRLQYFLGYPNWKDASDDAMEASLRVTYQNDKGTNFETSFDFDFGQMRDVLFESFKDSNLAVAEAIKDAERSRQSHEWFGPLRTFDMMKKTCPMCAEVIPGGAKKCSHCGHMLEEGSPTDEST
jgi:hypothetical protein